MRISFLVFALAVITPSLAAATLNNNPEKRDVDQRQRGPAITDSDLRFADLVVTALSNDECDSILNLLSERQMRPERMEEILSVIFLTLADEKLTHAEAEVERRGIADTSKQSTTGSAPRVPLRVTKDDLRTGLRLSHEDVRRNLNRFFSAESELVEARTIIMRNREIAEKVFNVLQQQQPQEAVSHAQ